MPLNIVTRTPDAAKLDALIRDGVNPVLARILAARGVSGTPELQTELRGLLPFDDFLNVRQMAMILADAIAANKRLLIVGDYDADGATASALGVLALRRFGAIVDYLVPNRFEYGYGLTPEIVALAARRSPDFIITVDNGIASIDGVNAANARGIPVLVTDHHLPGAQLPAALCIVNPNQFDCRFPSKNLAGVGVMFYVMLALRAELRARGAFPNGEPNLAEYLDLVALGTVADVVALDYNNRVLVAQGLRRLQTGRARPGVDALMRVAGRDPARATAFDLGFVIGPRLNAAGRLEDMSQGIECLISDDRTHVEQLAQRLDALNRERRDIEADMQDSALKSLESFDPGATRSIVMFNSAWHPGVIGILASRLKDRFHRPAICFATSPDGDLRGSGRSIRALNLRDAIDMVDRRAPGLIRKFGGHAAAAGLTLPRDGLEHFCDAFEAVVAAMVSESDLDRVIETDGALEPAQMTMALAQQLRDQVWGQGFAPPTFLGQFQVIEQRVVGGKHSRLTLKDDTAGPRNGPIAAILFGSTEPLGEAITATYRLDINEWNHSQQLQLVVEHWARLR